MTSQSNYRSILGNFSNMLNENHDKSSVCQFSRHADSMENKKKTKMQKTSDIDPVPLPERVSPGRILSLPDDDRYLDTERLQKLEASFRAWAGESPRLDVQLSRKRILLIFLLIRYTGAKLNEVLALDPGRDVDFDQHSIQIGGRSGSGREPRQVQISAAFSHEIHRMIDDAFLVSVGETLDIDPGFVRRKFYERAQACGIEKHMATPEMIRQSRAVELIRSNMPLPAVQMFLGHSTLNPASSYVSFSDDDIRQVTRFFMEKESSRKTSARNSFFGKIRTIRRGIIQAQVELITISGQPVTTVITTDRLDRLGLKTGSLITAEVKAPWVHLQKGDEPRTTAENKFQGVIERIRSGDITCEYVVRLADGTELCSIVTRESADGLDLRENDPVWVLFNGFSVILHLD